ncbi:hypothetical protein TcWFU_004127 [Taenia crassiceps]|uniref:Uncharacterized protein n=1 Tax=Taenia crassiceps TaxID=6207 RepID=A0ABR4QQS2_9CEST
MVDFNEKGVYADYDPMTHKATHYWVVSLDPHVVTAMRLPAPCLRKYVCGALIDETLRKNKHWSRIKKAVEAAEDALKLPIHMRIERYGCRFSKKNESISKKGLPNRQRKYKARRFSTRIKHQKGNNSGKVSRRYQGRRRSSQEAIMGDVGIPLMGQAAPKRSRRLPLAYQISGEFLTQSTFSNSSGGLTNQELSQAKDFRVPQKCLSKCTPTASSRTTSLEGFSNHFMSTFGSPKRIFYKQIFVPGRCCFFQFFITFGLFDASETAMQLD